MNSLPNQCTTPKKVYDTPFHSQTLNTMTYETKETKSSTDFTKTIKKALNIISGNKSNQQAEMANQMASLNCDSNADLDALINQLELEISLIKKENQSFVEYIDDLNDSYINNEKEFTRLSESIKKMDKKIDSLTKDKNSLKKDFEKAFPDLKDKIVYNNINIDFDKIVNQNNLNKK